MQRDSNKIVALQAFPSGDLRWHAGGQAGDLLTVVLHVAVARVRQSSFGDLRRAQLGALLQAAARHEEAPRLLGSLAASPCLAALVPSEPSTLDGALAAAEGALCPFVERGAPAPRLESLCAAHLLRSLPGAIRGNHLSNATCLTQVFFKSGEECSI